MEELLKEFIEWVKESGKDAYEIFNEPDEAIEEFMKETGYKTNI